MEEEKEKLKGLITIKDIEKAKNYPQATKDAHGRLFVGAAVGVGADSMDRAAALVAAGSLTVIRAPPRAPPLASTVPP